MATIKIKKGEKANLDLVGTDDLGLAELGYCTDTKELYVGNGVSATSIGGEVLDEDDLVSDSDTKLVTQQSVKAYVDDEITGHDHSSLSALDGDPNPALSIDNDGNASLVGDIDIATTKAYKYDGVNGLMLDKGLVSYYSNTIVGAGAGSLGVRDQTVVGYNSGASNSGTYQTAMGDSAGQSNSGTGQTAIGYNAGGTNTNAYQTAIGYYTGYGNTGESQTAVGNNAGRSNISNFQTVVGNDAGKDNEGVNQTAMGYYTGLTNTGDYQTAMGRSAGQSNSGANQTAIGGYAGYTNTGTYQTAIGYDAGFNNTQNYQTAVGYYAGYSNSGLNQTVIGSYAGQSNTGNDVVAIGYEAGKDNTTDNIFIVKQNNINTTPLIQGDFSTGKITLGGGDNSVGINEFSSDGTLAGDSDDAVPTEKAVKAYVDNSGASHDHSSLSASDGDPNPAFSVDDVGISNTYGYLNVGGLKPTGLMPSLQIGKGRTGDGYAIFDLIGDTYYTTYAFRIARQLTNAPNADTELTHRGTGSLSIRANDVDATIAFENDSTIAGKFTSGMFSLGAGTGINEFSTDGTLADDSDDAVPTEKAVKAYVDSNSGGVPVGIVIPFMGGYFDNTSNGSFTSTLGNTVADVNTHLNSSGWYVCDGSELNLSGSPIFDGAGRHLPNLKDDRFIMGDLTAGGYGGSNTMAHTHTGPSHTHTGPIHNHTGPSHRHSHDHGNQYTAYFSLTTTYLANHDHNFLWNHDHVTGTGSYPVSNGNHGTNTRNHNLPISFRGDGDGHRHEVNITSIYSTYNGTGVTGDEGSGATGSDGTGNTGAASNDENRPKYLAAIYIIKAI